jgi:hypothetical protein
MVVVLSDPVKIPRVELSKGGLKKKFRVKTDGAIKITLLRPQRVSGSCRRMCSSQTR